MSRQTAVAGQFYPADKKLLEKELKKMLVVGEKRQKVLGLLAPHAGYVYSGPCAGQGYGRVTLTETVIILGVNHRGLRRASGSGRQRFLGNAPGQRGDQFRTAFPPVERFQAVCAR